MLTPRLSAMAALNRQRARDTQDELPGVAGDCIRVDELHLASVSDKEAAKAHFEWWDPR